MALGESGSDIAFTYHSNKQKALDLHAALRELGARSISDALDLAEPSALDTFFARTLDQFGRIDAVVHAAAPYPDQRFVSSFTSEQFRRHIDQELHAFFEVVRCSLPHLRASRGSITAVTSVANRRFPARDALSSVPKAGIEAIVRAVAVEEGRYGVRANAVGPGVLSDGQAIPLAATGDVPAEMRDRVERAVPLRRLGTGADVAAAVCFLVSPAASYITGQYIDVDGGYSL
jgi:NAD(P)-dependent dehydrogenase (short-subunit alcohol dehydrogenase family)